MYYLYHGGYTLPWVCTTLYTLGIPCTRCMSRTTRLPLVPGLVSEDEALGSREENPLGSGLCEG